MTVDISFLALLALSLILVPFIFISYHFKLNLLREAFISVFRMYIQLILVGVYLQYIFQINNTYINIVYIIIMICVATFSVINALSLKILKSFLIVFSPMLVLSLLLSTFFHFFIIRIDNIFDAKYFIPIIGMLLGNCLRANIICLNNFFQVFKDNEKEYLYTLALGATKLEALKPYMSSSLKVVLKPAFADIATLGIVTLPGMMTGQILGGASPMIAIKYQIAIMLMILAIKIYNSNICLLLCTKYFFDEYHIPNQSFFK